VIDSGKLPSDLNDSIDAIRNIGNFAAQPVKASIRAKFWMLNQARRSGP